MTTDELREILLDLRHHGMKNLKSAFSETAHTFWAGYLASVCFVLDQLQEDLNQSHDGELKELPGVEKEHPLDAFPLPLASSIKLGEGGK